MAGARDAALRALIAFRRDGAWPESALKDALRGMDRREAALATRLCNGVLQNRMLLDHWLSGFVRGKLQPVVRDILRLAAYQLCFLDRIPPSAAVNEAVEQTRRLANQQAARLVNGVLRNLLRAMPLALPDDLSLRYSHPEPIVRLFLAQFGREETERILQTDNEAPQTVLQVNPLRGNAAALLEELPGAQAHPWLPGCLTVSGPVEQTAAFHEGRVYVQDAAAHLAVAVSGIEPGMRVLTVNGEALTDMIVWLWEADDDTVDLEVFDPRDGTVTPVELDRFPGEDWGLEFDGPIFDGMRTCVNACVFCFMTMLPKGGRSTLYIRDDDYRLSFLQGNFVTLTNLTDEDVQNVIQRNMSPMNVSVHAVSPDVRRRMMGRNAQRGMDVLETIMAAGIEIHAQIVLCPGMNDGEELEKTLRFCEEHEQITSLGIVPLGFTKHQNRFSWSYSDKPELARETIAMIRPFQDRAYERFGRHTFQMSDEFYLDAGIDPPEADFYDGYPQYYDGIGMIRSYLDETDDVLAAYTERLARVREAIAARSQHLLCLSGASARDTVARFVESPQGLAGTVTAIKNRYFGGNVDVTGLIVACDILEQLPQDLSGVMLFVPKLMFNADGMTLDEYHRDDLLASLTSRGAEVHVVSTMPHELLDTLEHILGIVPADSNTSTEPTH